ncbi:MAG: hypothetical protein V2I31_12135 [Mariniphaga sp.]|jgi:hypothetical protein|nr:hypothetical protein [Mariniphaga sp.]
MRKLSLIFGILLLIFQLKAQENPHGDDFSFDCLDCHTTAGWTFSAATAKFSHDSTNFELEGQHVFTDCRACHTSLVFSEAKTNCMDCHTDMHNNTVGLDCARCHTPQSWLVSNITEIHQMSRFPLLGAHNTADCAACHSSASTLEFQPLGVECMDCHRQDYIATTNPNHVQAGLSTDCFECHKIDAFTWSSKGFNHDFFPLTKGHEINDCAACHSSGVFEPVSSDCYSCHQADYTSATNPSHQNSGFSTQCADCHTTEQDWKPAKFDIHDQFYFPIYSGEHRGEWESCSECHTQPESYAVFSCTNCHAHNQGEMDSEHRGISGYSYNSLACFACHPLGSEEGAFNHDATGFPLKGAHLQNDCFNCHTNGFANTSSSCSSCHISSYNESVNPNHLSLAVSTNCDECHTENPGWEPASFPNHNDYYVLSGAHATVSNNCFLCHEGNYTNTPNSCFGCHSSEYNGTTDPNHSVAQFPTDCVSCHSESAWTPSTFNHDGQYFPIYSGKHSGEWNSCADCHTQATNYSVFSCIACHEHNRTETDSDHRDVNGYVYTATSCYECHPTGREEDD